MKINLLIVLMMLVTLSVKSQCYLGYNKEELVRTYMNAHSGETFQTEWKQLDSGDDYVIFSEGLKMKSYFFKQSHGLCYLYIATYPNDNINDIITVLNSKYVKEGDYLWIDYSNVVPTKWEIRRSDDHYNLVVSVK